MRLRLKHTKSAAQEYLQLVAAQLLFHELLVPLRFLANVELLLASAKLRRVRLADVQRLRCITRVASAAECRPHTAQPAHVS